MELTKLPELKVAESIVTSEYTFALMFIIVLYVFYKWVNKNYDEHKADSKERENKLMAHLEKSNDVQERTSKTLDKIEYNLTTLENKMEKMDTGISDIWKRIDEIDGENK